MTPNTMKLAADAPWALSVVSRLFATIILLASNSDALSGLRPAPQKNQQVMLLSIDQVPGPTPMYIKYGPPEFTTFSNLTTACMACIEFFPEKQDAKRFHSALYEDKEGGVWDRVCRAGTCDFRDPQTQPVGGVIGQGPDGKPQTANSCITRDPVPWYSDCEPIAKEGSATITEVTHFCSYREQIFIPPPTKMVSFFTGSKDNAWSRIGGSKEKLLNTIEKEGAALFDSMTFCDSDLPKLSGACESVFGALNCVAETSVTKGLWNPADGSVFSMYEDNDGQMLEAFAKYCVPLCQYTKEEFCENYPQADVCVSHNECSACTSKGGIWCPKLETCHCPSSKSPCIKPPLKTPLQCSMYGKEKPALRKGPPKLGIDVPKKKPAAPPAAPEEKPLCKYSKFALTWLQDEKGL